MLVGCGLCVAGRRKIGVVVGGRVAGSRVWRRRKWRELCILAKIGVAKMAGTTHIEPRDS
jgi:hypothetical protein